ncbi:MAG: hypothetical protein MZU95_01600 [Desulfomicrobium escambiense]|nr:hypothetical protein [Desulfomicrobium escambiense]
MVKNVTSRAPSPRPAAPTRWASSRSRASAPGLYALGVTSDRRDYNSQDFFGVAAGKTSKITIALRSLRRRSGHGRRRRHQGPAGQGRGVHRQGRQVPARDEGSRGPGRDRPHPGRGPHPRQGPDHGLLPGHAQASRPTGPRPSG